MQAVKRPPVIDAALDDQIVVVVLAGFFTVGNVEDHLLIVELVKGNAALVKGFKEQLFFGTNPAV